MANQTACGDAARQAILRGVNGLANAAKVTLGPPDRNVILERKFGAPTITKDGVTVAKEIGLPDAIENIGARMVKEVASKTSDIAGDGATTATVFAQARAVEEPRRWIANNAGHEGSIVIERAKAMPCDHGFNAQTEQYEDLVAAE